MTATTTAPGGSATRRFRDQSRLWEQGGGQVIERETDGRHEVVFQEVSILGPLSQNCGPDGRPNKYQLSDEVARLYEGQMVYMDHVGPNEPWTGRSVQLLAGRIQGAYYDSASDRIKAKELVLQKTEQTAHAIQIMRAQPQHVGMSHDVLAAEEEAGLRTISVFSVDIVPEPATTRGLYESDQSNALLRVGAQDVEGRTEVKVQASDGSWFLVSRCEQRGEQGTEQPNSMDANNQQSSGQSAEVLALRLEEETRKREQAERDLAAEREAHARTRSEIDLDRALEQAQLPDLSKQRLRTALVGSSAAEIGAAIAAEGKYLEQLGVNANGASSRSVSGTAPAIVTGAGPETPADQNSEDQSRVKEQAFLLSLGTAAGLSPEVTRQLAGIEAGTAA